MGKLPVSEDEDSVVRNGIRKAVCLNYFYGDENCPSCRQGPECRLMVDEAVKYVENLTSKRKSLLTKKGP